jgi:hypothetical protein
MEKLIRTGCVFVAALLMVPPTLMAEDHSDEGHHHHHNNEIGFSAGYIYLHPEDDSAPGVHLHFMKRISGEGIGKNLGVGVGAEAVFADHLHYGLMGSFGIYPFRSLAVVISPGILFVEHHDEYEKRYSTHIEASYGFFAGEWEIGPVIGFARSEDDRHYMLGLHVGKGF